MNAQRRVPVFSHLGIAVGAGTNVAIESADVVRVRNNPQEVAEIIWLSRATYSKDEIICRVVQRGGPTQLDSIS